MPAYVVLLPVKPPAIGKSRLRGLADADRTALATAFALDTAAACLAVESVGAVLVATDDVAFAGAVGTLGCVAIPDGVATDLNGTLRQTAAEAQRRWPDLVPVALCGDLPALRPEDLAEALAEAGPRLAGGTPAYVADADGTGTSLYAAPYDVFAPEFGIGSALAHDQQGLPVRADVPTLRRDVDDLEDLRAAAAYGLGPATAAVVRRLGL
jgi:2-phospho-L-lactate/phosphoenolpyruvate guanylyltransferase